MMTDCKNVASVFKALGDENRIRILQMLHGGELCCLQAVGNIEYYTAYAFTSYENTV